MTDRQDGPFGGSGSDGEPSEHGPTVRDKRRIDPVTGEVRPEARYAGRFDAAPGAERTTPDDLSAAAEMVALEAQVAERTADLQRVQAEYANYRRRVDRDRDAVRQVAVGGAVTDLLPVLDDIGRAREHGDLTGAFKSVSDSLDAALARLGLVTFGKVGDPFDPNRHEALLHSYSDEVAETTCTQIFQPGYQMGDRVLRAARVAVADPTEALPVGQPMPAEGSVDVGASKPDNDRYEREDGPGAPFGV